jgi:hypothetical protein
MRWNYRTIGAALLLLSMVLVGCGTRTDQSSEARPTGVGPKVDVKVQDKHKAPVIPTPPPPPP